MIKPRVLHSTIKINPKDGLEAAILKVAAEDYKDALVRLSRDTESHGNKREVRRLEKFFLGAWGQSLSRDLGELIIEKCKQEVRNAV